MPSPAFAFVVRIGVALCGSPLRPLVGVTASLFASTALVAGEAAAATTAAWTMRVWQSDDGLPNNHVTGLAQTPDGYLWVATYSAPARFDGVRFDQFLPKDLGVGSNQKISTLAPARSGGLWLGTLHGGVIQLDAKGVQLFTDGLPYKPVQEIVETDDGALWMSHQGGSVARLWRGHLTTFGPADGLPAPDTPNRYVVSFAVDGRGQLWFSKDGQVGVFRDEHFVTLTRLSPVNARITRARAGGVWIGSEGKLLKLDEGRPPEVRAEFGAQPTETTALYEDIHGAVWIGTVDAGLMHFDGTRILPVPTSDPRIAGIAEDRKGNLWVGTVGGGLNQIRPRLVTLETEAAGIPGGVVQSVVEDATGALWATTQSGLLLHRPADMWQTISAGPKWPGGRASALTVDADGGLWIGTRDRALHRWKDGAFTSWRRTEGLAGREVHALLAARDGDLWLGLSSPDVVQRLRRGRLETFAMPDGIRVIRAMTEDTAGNIWLGSSRGMLVRIRDGVVTDETRRTMGEPRSIRCLRATDDGGVWIGYADESIGWLKDGRFAHVASAQGFPEPNVSQIVPDATGWLWFAGDHGIFKVRQNALEDLALGRSPRAHFIRFGPSEGLFSLEANFGDAPGAARTRDGRLWIPLRTALAVIDPRQAREDLEPPPLLLKRVLVDDRVVATYGGTVPVHGALDLGDPNAALSLPPDHFRLGFDFTTLSYRAPENARFRHRLEGFDRDWVEAGTQRSVTYSRLPAGDYRFRVQACNSDGVWNDRGATFALTVRPFAWQTWWFRLGAVAAFTSATVIAVRRISLRRVRERLRQLEQQAAVQKERTRIARDLHDEFGTRLTELGLIAELERATGRGPVELIGNIRALERDLDTIIWAVNPKNDTLDQLVGFICRVSTEFLGRSGIRCRLDIPDELPPRPLTPEVRHHVFLVVREALTNVVKHAAATCVKLAIALSGETLRVQIENDGRGFDVAAAEGGERNGLKNMRGRIEELGGKFHLESRDDCGTTIELHVPLGSDGGPGRHARDRAAQPIAIR
jgi:signal transduction histidine kinase/ligand-binding sensor domain-containing protein